MTAVARFSLVALDTPDPEGLARFYAAITGWDLGDREGSEWIELQSDGGPTIAFQLAPDHVPPVWPDPARPQQAHLDFDVADLDEGESAVIALGARKADFQPSPNNWRIYLDPSGHPFCLVRAATN